MAQKRKQYKKQQVRQQKSQPPKRKKNGTKPSDVLRGQFADDPFLLLKLEEKGLLR